MSPGLEPIAVTASVFAALRSFARPATRAELERESGLKKSSVEAALRVLKGAKVLGSTVTRRRERGLYWLLPDAVCPPGRGKYPR